MTLPVIQVLCLAAFVACVASFVWAMSGRFFRKVEHFGAGFRLIQAGGALAFAANLQVLIAHGPIGWQPGVLALAFYGIALPGSGGQSPRTAIARRHTRSRATIRSTSSAGAPIESSVTRSTRRT